MHKQDCAYVCIYVQALTRLCVHIGAGTITPMCAYNVQAWLCLCAHIRAGTIMPICAYTWRHYHAYVCIYVQAWSRLCMHIRAGLIVLLCAYTCRPDCAYVCIHAWACSRPCVHIRAGMITPMCAYHDCASVCIYVQAWLCIFSMLSCGDENIKSTRQDQTCSTWNAWQCVCTHVKHLMRHSGQLFGTKEGKTFACSWQQSGEALHPAMPWAQKASEQQCRSQAIMPRLSGWARWCTNIESWKGLENVMF
jgi:hypothetical protein